MFNMKDIIIPEDQVEKIHKGRQKEIIEGLTEKLKDLKPNYAIKLKDTFGPVSKNERSKVSAIIRKHWYISRDDKPSIYYDEDGVPQVSARHK